MRVVTSLPELDGWLADGERVLSQLGLLPSSLPAFATGIYTAMDLYAGLADDGSHWEDTPDHAGFRWFMEGPGKPRPLSLAEMIAARLHDTVQERDVMRFLEGRKVVAIMGGHDVPRQVDRGPDIYWQCVSIAKTLSEKGFLILSGGGPGLMEAANLGALLTGAEPALVETVRGLLPNAAFGSAQWRASALAARRAILGDAEPAAHQESLGIPTWFYGHEPPNLFASHHAKMFYNSLREDGLVTWANKGILYFEGNAGTVQEIFQDAAQNYYPAPGTAATPMIFFNSNGYWDRPCDTVSSPGDRPMDKRKPLLPLIRQLAAEKAFTQALLVTSDPDEVVRFILAADAADVPHLADVKLNQGSPGDM
jgi:predicted Rossmann-fold nucleotide-binding protein